MSVDDFPAFMTVEEVARVLRMKPTGVRHMLRQGRIAGTHIGKRWLIEADEVRRVIREGTKGPIELAGGRKFPRKVEDQDQGEDDQRPVSPDQLALDLARRGSVDQARRDPGRGVQVRIIG